MDSKVKEYVLCELNQMLFSKSEETSVLIRPYKIIISLLDKSKVGNRLVLDLIDPIVTSLINCKPKKDFHEVFL